MNPFPPPSDRTFFLAGIPRFLESKRRNTERVVAGGWFPTATFPRETLWMGHWWKGDTELLVPLMERNQNGWSFWNMQPAYSFCEGAVPPSLSPPPNNKDHAPQTTQEFSQRLDDLPPCSTCRYTGMAVCAGLSLYFLKLANEETTATTAGPTMAKHASKTAKNHKPFFYGGALVWAAAGIYRSMLD